MGMMDSGEWKVEQRGLVGYDALGREQEVAHIEITDRYGDCIAWLSDADYQTAILMAAARDLLAACALVPPLLKEIRGFANDAFGGPSRVTDCIDLVLEQTEAAIAKAKGETK